MRETRLQNNHPRRRKSAASAALLSWVGRNKLEVKSLEVPVTQHCNLRCVACDHGSPLLGKSFLDLDQFAQDLTVLKWAMQTDEFRLVGGEPLQHPQLLSVIEVIRRSAIAKQIVLVTNGTLLHKADQALWRVIDRLWLSIYPGVSLSLSLQEIEDLCHEYNVRFDPRTTNNFRTVLMNNPIDDIDLVRSNYRECKTAHVWKCYTVLNGYFFKCSKSSVMRERLIRLGILHENSPVDGVHLRSRWRLKSRLEAYLESQEPLASCRACLGTSGPLIPHRQLNARALRAESEEDHTPLIKQLSEQLREKRWLLETAHRTV
jgi:organic radical activating enzyme